MSKQPPKPTRKTKRGKRGLGRLYKRNGGGREWPAASKSHGNFWLEYHVNGERRREKLTDDKGHPITDRRDAEKVRQRILAPYLSKDKVEALKQIEARLRDAKQEHARAEIEAAPVLRVMEAWERYLEAPNRPDTGESTLRQYECQWRRFARWITETHPKGNAVELRDVTPETAEQYAADLGKAGLTANTHNKHVRLLELVFRVLAKPGRILENPWPEIGRKKQRQNTRRELTTEELSTVSNAAQGEWRLLFALGIYSGMRLGDCATLKWSEVDLPRGFIVRVPNKTARTNGKAVRIPLYRDLAAMLTEARKHKRGEYVLPDAAHSYQQGTDALSKRIQTHFLNCGIDVHRKGTGRQIKRDKDGNPIRKATGTVEVKNTGKRAVVEIGFHSLRHTFVSLCRESDVPLATVEAIVGHSNPAMTRHYTHTGDAAAVAAIGLLPAITGEAQAEQEPEQAEPDRPTLDPKTRAALKRMTGRNWKKIRDELLNGGKA